MLDCSIMTEKAKIFLERVDAWLADAGRSRRSLSLEISDQKSGGVFADVARSGSIPKEARLRRLALATNLSVDYLVGRTNDPAAVASEVEITGAIKPPEDPAGNLSAAAQASSSPMIPLVGTGDCGEITLADEHGNAVEVERNSFDPDYSVRMIIRPPALLGARDLYAIYFQGESMVPRFEPGEVGIVDPVRPVRPGDYVLVQLTNGEDEDVATVLVKRLVRKLGRDLLLEQFNPPLTFTVPGKRVKRVHRIMPQTDLLFG